VVGQERDESNQAMKLMESIAHCMQSVCATWSRREEYLPDYHKPAEVVFKDLTVFFFKENNLLPL
jgi:hypothetical protein